MAKLRNREVTIISYVHPTDCRVTVQNIDNTREICNFDELVLSDEEMNKYFKEETQRMDSRKLAKTKQSEESLKAEAQVKKDVAQNEKASAKAAQPNQLTPAHPQQVINSPENTSTKVAKPMWNNNKEVK